MDEKETDYELAWQSEYHYLSSKSASTSWPLAALVVPCFALFEIKNGLPIFHPSLILLFSVSALLIILILFRKKIYLSPYFNTYGVSVIISFCGSFLCIFTSLNNVHYYLLGISVIIVVRGLLYCGKMKNLIFLAIINHSMAYGAIILFRSEPLLEIPDVKSIFFFQIILVLFSFAGTKIRYTLTRENFINALEVKKSKKLSDDLLLNILPDEVAEELKAMGSAKTKSFTMVTVMFTDFKDFTKISEKVSAELLVGEIHTCFSAFDQILQKHQIEKIKTIGDAYLCASGLPVSNYSHAVDMVNAAIEIRNYMAQRKVEKEAKGEIPFELRIGIHTGPVVAGIVGIIKYAYDIWGDTVNLAARVEQNSEVGKINISGSTYELVKDKFNCVHRGKIQAKSKGEIDMYFVEAFD